LCLQARASPSGGRLLGPLASLDDEQDVNDTLGQLLMVLQILDDEIGRAVWGEGVDRGHVCAGWVSVCMVVCVCVWCVCRGGEI
jgi:hypothetical protein